MDQLWAGQPPPSAAGTVHAYLSNLRRVLEPGRPARAATVLVSEPAGYRLRVDAAHYDVLRFEQVLAAARREANPEDTLALYDQALGLWYGPALADFEYEDFTVAWRARLDEHRARAVEARLELLLAVGHAADAAVDVADAVATWPVREHLRALQVTALARAGREPEALRAYEGARRYLADELGLSPGPELETAYRHALVGDHARRRHAGAMCGGDGGDDRPGGAHPRAGGVRLFVH